MPSTQLVKDFGAQEIPDVAKWDPTLTEHVVGVLRPVAKHYFRSEVHNLGRIPSGGALLVSNHSGGPTTTDLPTFAVHFYDKFGYHRPLYTLSHDVLSVGFRCWPPSTSPPDSAKTRMSPRSMPTSAR
jgi:1-acyl-sn-glycerol-3-phosphate acyltransferase